MPAFCHLTQKHVDITNSAKWRTGYKPVTQSRQASKSCRIGPGSGRDLKGLLAGNLARPGAWESILDPGQAMETPAAVGTALLQLVELSLETLEDVERIAETGLREGLGSGHGTGAAAAQQQEHVVAPH